MRIRSLTMLALLYGGSAYADADMTGTRELQMMQCPSATPGAKTRLRKIRHGVELRVSADEEWQRRELRRRARHQAETTAQRTRGHEEHTGEGTGSGRFGYCPGILDGTQIAVDQISDGVRMTVLARNAGDVAELQRSATARLARLRHTAVSAKR